MGIKLDNKIRYIFFDITITSDIDVTTKSDSFVVWLR